MTVPYLLQEDHESVDVDLFTHTAQTKIHQRLQAGEFPGIPEQHIYRGRIYNGCVVKDRRILKICNNDTKNTLNCPKLWKIRKAETHWKSKQKIPQSLAALRDPDGGDTRI